MTAMRRLFCGLAMVGACAVFGACQGLPPMPQAAPVASPGGTWVGQGQVFVFCPGGKMLVLDPSMQVTWCRGTHGADGRFSADCSVNGRSHTSTGQCTLNGNVLSCPYSSGGQSYSFNGTRSSGGDCRI